MIRLVEGGVTDLRSVPEQSLADSIFSLEDGNVQNLECLTACACARAWGCVRVLRAVSLRRSAQNSLQQTSETCDLLLHGLHSLPADTVKQKSPSAPVSQTIIPALVAIVTSQQHKQAVPTGNSETSAGWCLSCCHKWVTGVFTWSPSRSPAEVSRTPPRPLPLLQDRPSGRVAPR